MSEICEMCGVTFKTMAGLSLHQRRTHHSNLVKDAELSAAHQQLDAVLAENKDLGSFLRSIGERLSQDEKIDIPPHMLKRLEHMMIKSRVRSKILAKQTQMQIASNMKVRKLLGDSFVKKLTPEYVEGLQPQHILNIMTKLDKNTEDLANIFAALMRDETDRQGLKDALVENLVAYLAEMRSIRHLPILDAQVSVPEDKATRERIRQELESRRWEEDRERRRLEREQKGE